MAVPPVEERLRSIILSLRKERDRLQRGDGKEKLRREISELRRELSSLRTTAREQAKQIVALEEGLKLARDPLARLSDLPSLMRRIAARLEGK